MILDLPPQLEQVIVAKAQHARLSVDSFVISQLQQLNTTPKQERTLGGGEQYLIAISDDFDAPLDDFADYM